MIRPELLGAAIAAFAIYQCGRGDQDSHDAGGQIGHYIEAFASLRSSGERGLSTGLAFRPAPWCSHRAGRPHLRTRRAKLGFHAALAAQCRRPAGDESDGYQSLGTFILACAQLADAQGRPVAQDGLSLGTRIGVDVSRLPVTSAIALAYFRVPRPPCDERAEAPGGRDQRHRRIGCAAVRAV